MYSLRVFVAYTRCVCSLRVFAACTCSACSLHVLVAHILFHDMNATTIILPLHTYNNIHFSIVCVIASGLDKKETTYLGVAS